MLVETGFLLSLPQLRWPYPHPLLPPLRRELLSPSTEVRTHKPNSRCGHWSQRKFPGRSLEGSKEELAQGHLPDLPIPHL